MKNKKLVTAAALVGLTLGGLSVASAASAQGYGGAPQDAPVETVQVDPAAPGGIVLVQDGETDENAPEGEREGRRGHRGGCNLEAAAEAIGIDEADLKAALESGDTIADVAAANGVSVDAVITAMVDAKQERISEKVAEGRLTQAEADEKLANATDRITDRVNGVETDRDVRGPDA